MTSPISAATEAVSEGFGNYEPENVADLRGFFTDMPKFFGELASSVTALADRFDEELPLHPAIAEHVREMVSVIAGLGDHAEELQGMFESAHEKELQRIDSPRSNEEFLDVSHNQ